MAGKIEFAVTSFFSQPNTRKRQRIVYALEVLFLENDLSLCYFITCSQIKEFVHKLEKQLFTLQQICIHGDIGSTGGSLLMTTIGIEISIIHQCSRKVNHHVTKPDFTTIFAMVTKQVTMVVKWITWSVGKSIIFNCLVRRHQGRLQIAIMQPQDAATITNVTNCQEPKLWSDDHGGGASVVTLRTGCKSLFLKSS